MPVYDFECTKCGEVKEVILFDVNINEQECPICSGTAKKIISAGGTNCFNEDADWIRSITEVVDKDGGRHCQEFLKRPTRANYKKWMKKEGVRHREDGEPLKPPPVDEGRLLKKTMERHMRRSSLTVR
jgi:putative FmdB family regulatory protein